MPRHQYGLGWVASAKPTRTRTKVDIVRVKTMYCVQHLTMQQIGAVFGITRQGVYKILKKAGVARAEGERVSFQCEHCQQACETTRGRWRASRKHYCSPECYYASIYNPALVLSTEGCRKSRALVRQYFDLQRGHIVHHHDSDQSHVALENLAVFENAAAHMSYERGGSAKPIWDGAALAEFLQHKS